ncbi:MAG: type II secretion system protein [Clostridiales bacterium]|nr:type II secretion system protein [Clostridiales bacterium]
MQKDSGFTLIEVLMSLVIIYTLLIVIYTTFMQSVFLKNKSDSYYKMIKTAQSIMEYIKSEVYLIYDDEEYFGTEMEKEINFTRDGYNGNVMIIKQCPDKGIYKIIVTVIDEKYNKEYILETIIYDRGQKDIYRGTYNEIPL